MDAEKEKPKKMKTTDMKLSRKVKVIYLKGTSHEGEIAEIDRGLAAVLVKNKKVQIL